MMASEVTGCEKRGSRCYCSRFAPAQAWKAGATEGWAVRRSWNSSFANAPQTEAVAIWCNGVGCLRTLAMRCYSRRDRGSQRMRLYEQQNRSRGFGGFLGAAEVAGSSGNAGRQIRAGGEQTRFEDEVEVRAGRW
nr:hypothetical protein CFP56_00711 [Quercus suber]